MYLGVIVETAPADDALRSADPPLHRGAPLGDPGHRYGTRRRRRASQDRARGRGPEPDRAAVVAAASIRAAATRRRSAMRCGRRSPTSVTAASPRATIHSAARSRPRVKEPSSHELRRKASFSWDGHETWNGRVVGTRSGRAASSKTPVVICHGGPGAAHDYVRADRRPRGYERACVLYDQLGCGKSEHLPEAPAEFWTPQLFKDELGALTRHLGIDGRLCRHRAVVGRNARDGVRPGSAGGAARDRSSPIRRRACGYGSSEANRLRRDLPEDVQETLTSARAGRERRPIRSTRPPCGCSTTATCAVCRGRTAVSADVRADGRPTRPSTTR